MDDGGNVFPPAEETRTRTALHHDEIDRTVV